MIRHRAVVVLLLAASTAAGCAGRPPAAPARGVAAATILESSLEIFTMDSGERRVVYRARAHFEAPNWSRDGKALIYNSGGRIYTVAVAGGEPRAVDTGRHINCNNAHGLSPDGGWLAISDGTDGGSRVFVLPSAGGTPRLLTPEQPSYWHGWSPDGRTLAYCAKRGGNFDVYTVPVSGGGETRLTDAPGLDDGPDFGPDGTIYFNSERTGLMKIWRMNAAGRNQRQVTTDGDHADWVAHPSPDGTQLVFVSYNAGVKGHPANQDVTLRALPLPTPAGAVPRVLAHLFGGQGTINVPSWSPDSRAFAFVSYRLVPPALK
jgi:Tol biopolymer transport system component